MQERVILHSDLNNYYASVECMMDPSLKGKFVAVCGKREDRHGIVLAKNQKAKLCGVKTGEPIWQAMQKCPDLVVVPPHMDLYIKYSKLVHKIYYRYTDYIEPFGLDECWLDVSASRELFGTGEDIAHSIRKAVKQELGLTVSVGVSFNKIFAKLGSDMKKPDAVTVITRENFPQKTWGLPMGELLGIGRQTNAKLQMKGLRTIGDIARCDPSLLRSWLGINGEKIWRYANGLDFSRVRPFGDEPIPQSLGHGITCTEDLYDNTEVRKVICELAQNVSHRLRENNLSAAKIQLGIKDNLLCRRDYQFCLKYPTQSWHELTEKAMQLFLLRYDWHHPVRALSVTALGLQDASLPIQPDLFCDASALRRQDRLETSIERIRHRYGRGSIDIAAALTGLKMPLGNAEETLIMPKAMYV